MVDIRAGLSTSTPNFPEWLHLDKDAIPGVLRTLEYWLTTKKSTKTMLSMHQHQSAEALHTDIGLIGLKTGNAELQRKIEEASAKQRREMAESIRAMPVDMLMSLKFVPRGASLSQARALLEQNIDSLVDQMQASHVKGRVTGYEELWYEQTQVFLPPRAFNPSNFNAAWDQLHRESKINGRALAKVSRHQPFI